MKSVSFCSFRERLVTLIMKIEDYDPDDHESDGFSLQEAEIIIKEIEQEFNINNFNIEDYYLNAEEVGAYHRATPYHMSAIYSVILHHIVDHKNIERAEKEPYIQKLIRYYRDQIDRMEKNGSSELTSDILNFLHRLVFIFLKINDPINMIKTLKSIYQKKSATTGKDADLANWQETFLTERYREYISKTVHEFEEAGLKFFGWNPQLMDSYMDMFSHASDNEPVLILGETGTGKELVARIIHGFSQRRDNNFWAVNCGGFTESLFNSELYGICDKAATGVGARLGAFLKACGRDKEKEKRGYVIEKGKISFKQESDRANDPTNEDLEEIGGTLFLDEVNSLAPELQSKLLRAIQEQEVQVVGEDRTRRFNLKIICSSNTDISDSHQGSEFRRDLYYRISRGIVRLPALRDMKESIPQIAEYEIGHLAKKLKANIPQPITQRAIKKLKSYDWPGNYRELENVLYRALKRAKIAESSKIDFEHIENLTSQKMLLPAHEEVFSGKTYEEISEMYMRYAYEKAKGKISETEKITGLAKTPTRTRLQRYNIVN